MKNIFEITPQEGETWCLAQGQPKFRWKQIREWLFQPGMTDFSQMSNLPKALRETLAAEFFLRGSRVVTVQGTERDPAEKFLLELQDGNRIEMVILHNDQGEHTLCASTQVGCAMRCAFCASGLDGVVRNLTSEEILEQFLLAADHLNTRGQKLSHAVIMGMGEPTANLENLLAALETVTASAPGGLGIGARRITISTVGIPPGIRKLADHPQTFHLAVSLHAPNDELRSRIMPSNRNIGIASVLDAAAYYFEKTGRRVTYEYILLAGVNDSDECARQLGRLLRHQNALVNLIPYNPVSGLPFETPGARQVERFRQTLESFGLQIALRHRKGDKIDAACGQLRRRNG